MAEESAGNIETTMSHADGEMRARMVRNEEAALRGPSDSDVLEMFLNYVRWRKASSGSEPRPAMNELIADWAEGFADSDDPSRQTAFPERLQKVYGKELAESVDSIWPPPPSSAYTASESGTPERTRRPRAKRDAGSVSASAAPSESSTRKKRRK